MQFLVILKISCYFIIYADSCVYKSTSIVDFRQIYEDVLSGHNYGIFIDRRL